MKYLTETRLFWMPELFEEPTKKVSGFKEVYADDVPEDILTALNKASIAKQINN